MPPDTGVFVLRDTDTLIALQPASFATEDDFQTLIERFPALLAGDQIDTAAPRRFLLVSREHGVADGEGAAARWSLDHLFLDQDGVPTLVEVKRASDTRLRREMVGQMLDYAANGVLYWPAADIRAQVEARCGRDGTEVSISLPPWRASPWTRTLIGRGSATICRLGACASCSWPTASRPSLGASSSS